MLRIRIGTDARSRFELTYTEQGGSVLTADGSLGFNLSDKERVTLRSYWEDYLEYPGRIDAQTASRIEQSIGQLGSRLFQDLFATLPARAIWRAAGANLAETRVEIELEPESEWTSVPWEYLRDPVSKTFVSAAAGGFVRKPLSCVKTSSFEPYDAGPIRVLLAAMPPPGERALAFRPTARRLFRAVGENEHRSVQVELLRPPTIGQLSNALLEAEATEHPYHIVQIDSHAFLLHAERFGSPGELRTNGRDAAFARMLPGERGYIPFDDPTGHSSAHLLDGGSLGELLHQARVPLLVLNSRRAADSRGDPFDGSPEAAFHSLALDVVHQGVAGVLAIPNCIDTAACAQFLLNVYAHLALGEALGEVATTGRQWLRGNPGPKRRKLAFVEWDLATRKWRRGPSEEQIVEGLVREQDWLVPIIYEAEAKSLVEADFDSELPRGTTALVSPPARTQADRAHVDIRLPAAASPDLYGMEDVLVAIDRAWETDSVVLLHGDAGAGKTSSAVEYARWYVELMDSSCRVLYTSFEQYRSFEAMAAELRDALGVPATALELEKAAGDPFFGAGHLLDEEPLLWIWDHVENLSGDLNEEDSVWSLAERDLFVEFLAFTQQSGANLLLLSRHEETLWLGEIATRVKIEPLPLRQSLQLIQGILSQSGHTMKRVQDWLPLAECAAGNPLAVRCLTEQALSEKVDTRDGVERFVARVRGRTMALPRDAGEVPASLNAALTYVLQYSFRAGDRKMLSLLHLFRGAVSRVLLEAITRTNSDGAAGVTGETPDDLLLTRATRLGLLSEGEGDNYAIPAALKPFLCVLFERRYSASPGEIDEPFAGPSDFKDRVDALDSMADQPGRAVQRLRQLKNLTKGELDKTRFGLKRSRLVSEGPSRAKRAYLEVMGCYGSQHSEALGEHRKGSLEDLSFHNANLLHACSLALAEQDWKSAAGAVAGLGAFYSHKGDLHRWDCLLRPLIPTCAQRSTRVPLPGTELLWREVMGQSAVLAHRRDRLTQARGFQEMCVKWDREQAVQQEGVEGDLPVLPERHPHRDLADSIHQLGEILREQYQPSLPLDEEAVALLEELGEASGAADWALQFGRSYADLPEGRGLMQAERWLKRAVDLVEDEDHEAKSLCLGELGHVAWLQFAKARRAGGTEHDLRRHLMRARRYYQRAIEFDRADAFAVLARHHQALGHVSLALGDVDFALPHYRESIRYDDLCGNRLQAASTRFELAIDLRNGGHSTEALRYAEEALHELSALDDSDGLLARIQLFLKDLRTGRFRLALAADTMSPRARRRREAKAR